MFNLFNLLDLYADWLVYLNSLWETVNLPFYQIFLNTPSIFSNGVGVVLQLLGIANFTLLEFIFGAGLAIYIVYQLGTWFLNLIN